MKVLIVGAGIAGPTLAYWLQKAGHEPTLVERALGYARVATWWTSGVPGLRWQNGWGLFPV